MSNFSEEDTRSLEKLTRIRLSDDEKAVLVKNLQSILDLLDKLQSIQTDGIEPTYHVLDFMKAPLREDSPKRLLSREAFLENAQAHVGGMIRVPPVIKDEL